MTNARDGYGRCSYCGGPFGDTEHTARCRYRREWRPLLTGEYPPPGPTRTGRTFAHNGVMYRAIEVYAPAKGGAIADPLPLHKEGRTA